jgi:general secretion pathway protein C
MNSLIAMRLSSLSTSWHRWVAFVFWLGAAVSGTYWVLQFPSGQTLTKSPLAQSAEGVTLAVSLGHVAQVLGAHVLSSQSNVEQSVRFQLLGVVAGTSGRGSALIGVDGEAPRAFMVGQTVADGIILKSLGAKQAQLGEDVSGAKIFSIELPPISDKEP